MGFLAIPHGISNLSLKLKGNNPPIVLVLVRSSGWLSLCLLCQIDQNTLSRLPNLYNLSTVVLLGHTINSYSLKYASRI